MGRWSFGKPYSGEGEGLQENGFRIFIFVKRFLEKMYGNATNIIHKRYEYCRIDIFLLDKFVSRRSQSHSFFVYKLFLKFFFTSSRAYWLLSMFILWSMKNSTNVFLRYCTFSSNTRSYNSSHRCLTQLNLQIPFEFIYLYD